MEKINLLVPVGLVPEQAAVTKATGEKKYTVRHQLKIFHKDKETDLIAEKGVSYLVGDDGSINAFTDETLVKYPLHLDDAINFLTNIQQNGGSGD